MSETEVIEKLEVLFRNYRGGWADDYSKREALGWMRKLDGRFNTGYDGTNVFEVKRLTEIFFSERKHQTYTGGLDQVRSGILVCLRELHVSASQTSP